MASGKPIQGEGLSLPRGKIDIAEASSFGQLGPFMMSTILGPSTFQLIDSA